MLIIAITLYLLFTHMIFSASHHSWSLWSVKNTSCVSAQKKTNSLASPLAKWYILTLYQSTAHRNMLLPCHSLKLFHMYLHMWTCTAPSSRHIYQQVSIFIKLYGLCVDIYCRQNCFEPYSQMLDLQLLLQWRMVTIGLVWSLKFTKRPSSTHILNCLSKSTDACQNFYEFAKGILFQLVQLLKYIDSLLTYNPKAIPDFWSNHGFNLIPKATLKQIASEVDTVLLRAKGTGAWCPTPLKSPLKFPNFSDSKFTWCSCCAWRVGWQDHARWPACSIQFKVQNWW